MHEQDNDIEDKINTERIADSRRKWLQKELIKDTGYIGGVLGLTYGVLRWHQGRSSLSLIKTVASSGTLGAAGFAGMTAIVTTTYSLFARRKDKHETHMIEPIHSNRNLKK